MTTMSTNHARAKLIKRVTTTVTTHETQLPRLAVTPLVLGRRSAYLPRKAFLSTLVLSAPSQADWSPYSMASTTRLLLSTRTLRLRTLSPSIPRLAARPYSSSPSMDTYQNILVSHPKPGVALSTQQTIPTATSLRPQEVLIC